MSVTLESQISVANCQSLFFFDYRFFIPEAAMSGPESHSVNNETEDLFVFTNGLQIDGFGDPEIALVAGQVVFG
jgi:hypothetical protein